MRAEGCRQTLRTSAGHGVIIFFINGKCVDTNAIAHAVLYVRQMQTHALWRDVKVHNGTSLNQVKPVRVPDTPMKKKFFCKLREE